MLVGSLLPAPPSVAPEASVAAAAAIMRAARASCVLARAPGAPPLLFAAGDLVGLVAAGAPLEATPIGAVAAPAPRARRADLGSLADALRLLGAGEHLIVEDDDGRVLGLLTPASLLAACGAAPHAAEGARLAAERDAALAEVSSMCAILEAARDIIATVTTDGHILFLNAAARAMLGVGPSEDLSGAHIAAFHPPEVLARIQGEFLPQVAATGAWEGETAFLSRGGARIPVWQIIIAHRGPDGAIARLSTIGRDISERLSAAQELRESEERLRLALVAANQGLYDLNLKTGLAVVTPEYATMLGYDPATFEETNAHWLERMHPDDVEAVGAVFRAYVAGELPDYKVEFRQRSRDGGWKWIFSAGKILARDEGGQPLRMLGTHTDITTRKAAEETLRQFNQELERRVAERTAALQASEEHLRGLADRLALAARSAALGIWDWDIVADVLTWDQRMYELYGLEPEAFGSAYAAWAGGLHPDDRAAAEEAIQLALRGQKEFDTEFRVRHPDGTVRYIKAYGLVRRDLAGEPLRMIGINYDITAEKQAAAREREISTQLAAANKELEAFAYSVSHDLRAPLRAIDGFSQALVEDYGPQLDAEARGYLARIRGGVRRMSQLIDDLLQLARVSRVEMRRSRVDLSELVSRAAAELREANPGREVELVLAPRALTWGDPNLLRVALDNLLSNAWKFTSRSPRARVEFGVARTAAGITYFVRDDGVGYDPAYASKLFGVFQRLHDDHEFPGTGIGLATVQRVIHRHGGEVWAEGAVGRGATFYFTLPAGHPREER